MATTTRRRTWAELKRLRMSEPGAQAGYARARRAYELGRQIRELRTAQGLSQEKLAEMTGTSQAAVARIEAGGVMPTIDSLDRIGAALGADLVVRFEVHHAGAAQSPALPADRS